MGSQDQDSSQDLSENSKPDIKILIAIGIAKADKSAVILI